MHLRVWQARRGVGEFDLLSEPAYRTRSHFEAVYQSLGQRMLADERVAFPAALPADWPAPSPLTDAERAAVQRWTLELRPIADPTARQARLVTASAPGQPILWHSLAWRLGRAVWWAPRWTAEPATGVNS